MLRRVKIKDGFILQNICGIEIPEGLPMVGSKYCMEECPYNNGKIKIFGFEFIKCKK